MFVSPGLDGDWSLVREWGMVGSPRTIRKDWFDTEPEALEAAEKVFDAKKKKGYEPKSLLKIVPKTIYTFSEILPIYNDY